jgi:hypothetical protein
MSASVVLFLLLLPFFELILVIVFDKNPVKSWFLESVRTNWSGRGAFDGVPSPAVRIL